MPVTEEQRQRAEANKLAALQKRKAFTQSILTNQHHQQREEQNPWRLYKCRKVSPEQSIIHAHSSKLLPLPQSDPDSKALSAPTFRARLEICSPDSFSVTPEAIQGLAYPGDEECMRILSDCLTNVMLSHYTQLHGGGKACVYKLRDYDAVLACLKSFKSIEIEKIPFSTLNVIQRLSHMLDTGQWEPCRPEYLTDEKVDELIGTLPRKLLDSLLPFQLDGLRFGLRRGGRCLIADEMGLGKTLQAISIAGCFINEGPILIVCPAILRFQWAEEMERWLPCCLPSQIHLVFGHRNNPAYLTRCPRVVVISYTMLHHLRKSMLEQEWALLIVDESHHVRCSKKKSEPKEIRAVLDVAAKVKRIVLLSGTPSLSRPYDIFHQINMLWPGLLGQNKYDFAKIYCAIKFVQTSKGKGFQDFSKGVRLEELNVLLKQTVMIRRLKEHVLKQLPPKRRQIIRLLLKRSDILSAKAAVGVVPENKDAETMNSENLDEHENHGNCCKSRELSYQELGIAKLQGFRDWLSIHPLILEPDEEAHVDADHGPQKMIVFAHHHKVLDRVQDFICEKGVGFVRIDGNTLARDRQTAVSSFQSSNEVKVAIVGITAGGVGLDFSAAQNVVFLELPQSPSLMLQAEDRAHRRGQKSAVNIYIFCAKDSMDERHWKNLNRSLHRVSSTTNGKYDAIPEIMVHRISFLQTSGKTETSYGDQVLRESPYCELPSVELAKLADSDLVMDTQPLEMHDNEDRGLIDGRENCNFSGCSIQMDDLHHKASMIPNENTDNDFLANKKQGDVCEVEIGCDTRSSSLEHAEETGTKNQKDYEQCHQKHISDGEPAQKNDNEVCSDQVYSLRFEVSKYTERIHLYSCIPGEDARPQPLLLNFRPEELELLNLPTQSDNIDTASRTFTCNPAYRHALLEFIREWNALKPIERRKLQGKTLQLPLSVELCFLNENTNHNIGGLLKGGSKRRVTPCYEISHPLPSNAIWKKINLSSGHGKKEKQYTQGWTITDEPLCKLCQSPCEGYNARTPEYFEDLFCNLNCYEEYRLRTSSRFLRQELFNIEHGVCTNCRLDCHQLVKTIKPLPLERRREYIEKVAPKVACQKKLLEKLVNDPSEGNAWHADHIIPVYRGGGECRLENMRTLCVACHFDVTATQHIERRVMRARARKQLKAIIDNLNCDQNTEEIDNSITGQEQPQTRTTSMVDDDLFVKVPGSAYSSVNGSEKA